MKKVLAVVTGLVFGMCFYLYAQQQPPAEVVIKDIQKTQPPVTLSHQKHVKDLSIKCVECHHTYKEGQPAEKCSSCHKAEAEGKKVGLKDAYHTKCTGCHKKEKAAGKNAPTLCKDCHKK